MRTSYRRPAHVRSSTRCDRVGANFYRCVDMIVEQPSRQAAPERGDVPGAHRCSRPSTWGSCDLMENHEGAVASKKRLTAAKIRVIATSPKSWQSRNADMRREPRCSTTALELLRRGSWRPYLEGTPSRTSMTHAPLRPARASIGLGASSRCFCGSAYKNKGVQSATRCGRPTTFRPRRISLTVSPINPDSDEEDKALIKH